MDITKDARRRLLRRGFALEYATLGWNVVLAVIAITARSVALAWFELDSLIDGVLATAVLAGLVLNAVRSPHPALGS